MNKVNICGFLVLSQLLLCSCDSKKGIVDNLGITISIISIGLSIFCLIIICLKWNLIIFNNVGSNHREELQKNNSNIKTEDCNDLVNAFNSQKDEIALLKESIKELESVVNEIKSKKNTILNESSVHSQILVDTKAFINSPEEDKHVKKYFYLKVIDGGKLVTTQNPESAHYRAWSLYEFICFEFCCSKIGRAINNRSSIIVPFCDVLSGTIDPDSAQNVIVKKEGTLSNDLSVLTKVLIQYS